MPNEPSLLHFKGQLERQTDEHDTRRLVDETVQKCRALLDSSPQEALQIVQDRLRMFPGNERLQVLHASIEQHLQRRTTEEVRVRYLTLANEALNKRQYQEAVRVLEKCQAEGAFSDEMRGLLDFARHEANRNKRESMAEGSLLQAQNLMSKGEYTEAIKLLEPLVAQTADVALTKLLEKARAQKQDLQQRVEAISNGLAQFVREEQFDEGVAFLKSQPEAVLRHAAAQEALKALRSLRDQNRRELQAIGTAYAGLDKREMTTGWTSLQACWQAHPDSDFLKRMVQTFDGRRKEQANRMLDAAMEQARNALAVGDAAAAQETLDGAAFLMESASPELQSRWQTLAKEVARSKILSRIGMKGPRVV